eukprot:2758403-Lingulodinium_polyedra.AAC.1
MARRLRGAAAGAHGPFWLSAAGARGRGPSGLGSGARARTNTAPPTAGPCPKTTAPSSNRKHSRSDA